MSNCTLDACSYEDVNDYVVVCVSAQIAIDPPWVVLEEYHLVVQLQRCTHLEVRIIVDSV